MIEVRVRGKGETLCVITITRLKTDPILQKNDELADYLVRTVVKRGNDMSGIYTRIVENWPRNSLNSLALLKAALGQFNFDTLGLEDDYEPDDAETGTSDMAWRLARALPQVPSEETS